MAKIYITGDIHAGKDIHCLNSRNFPEGSELTRDDFVIIVGDFGLPWCNDKEDQYWLRWLSNKPYTVLFIDGNHENFTNLYSFPVKKWNGGSVHVLRDNIYHLSRGSIYSLDGIQVFCFGGAMSHDKQYRKEGISWWKEELPVEEEYDRAYRNLASIDWRVDLVITHTAPRRYVSKLLQLPYVVNEETRLHDFLEEIDEKLVFTHWYFGHFHQDYSPDDKHTVVYNRVHRFR